MQQVKVYKTDDGTLFQNHGDAVTHELMIKLRGIIQSHTRSPSLSATEIAQLLTKEQDRVFDTIGKYRRTMGSIKGAATKIA
jgi:DNA-directed RNA polymerase specialized sigma54-like protein